MQCPKCGSANPDEAFFCGSCGQQLRSSIGQEPGPVELGTLPEAALTEVLTVPVAAEPAPAIPQDSWQIPASAEPAAAVPPPAQYGAVPPPPPPPAASSYPPAYQAPASAYGIAAPFEGNTSGMGTTYPAPPFTQGWSFAGFVPFGAFAFTNGSSLWGALWWVLGFFGFSIVYSIYVGIKGREMAWQGRRFDSIEQFEGTMKAWNTWGLVCLIVGASLILLYIIFFVVIMGVAMSDPNAFQ
jgi:hypothetical protein